MRKTFGGAGYRSRYLSHAKRALYHLSYAPHVTLARLRMEPVRGYPVYRPEGWTKGGLTDATGFNSVVQVEAGTCQRQVEVDPTMPQRMHTGRRRKKVFILFVSLQRRNYKLCIGYYLYLVRLTLRDQAQVRTVSSSASF